MGCSGEPLLPLIFILYLLFFCPRLRHVLNAWFTNVTDQYERQSVCVRPTELINARALAGLGDRPNAARFLNGDLIACDRIVAPDFCLWLGSHDMKCAIGINCPDSPQ